MNKQFTASEVRGQIAWLRNVTVVGTKTTYQMLDAFADLLEAQERAVPVVTRESAINAIEHVGRYNGPGRETEAHQMLVEGSPSVVHHAQAQPPTASVPGTHWFKVRAWLTDESFGYDLWKADMYSMGKGTYDAYLLIIGDVPPLGNHLKECGNPLAAQENLNG